MVGQRATFSLPIIETENSFNFLQLIIMSAQRTNPQYQLFDAIAATASSAAILVQDRQHLFLTFSSTGSANFTMKFQVSYSDTKPDFSAAASPTNQRSYVSVMLATTRATIDGTIGITAAGTDSTMNYEVNLSGARWFGATITAYSAGALYLRLAGRNNN